MIPIIITLLLIAFDQLTKYITLTRLQPIGRIELIPGFFNLTYVENRGAAFGTMQGARWLFVILAAGVLAAGVIYYIRMEKKRQNLLLRAAIVLIASGAVGNAIDRIFRSYVVDFLDFIIFGWDFPVFNVADISIVIGTALLIIYLVFFDGKKNKESDSDALRDRIG